MSKKKGTVKQDENLENVEHALTKSEEFIEKYQKELSIGLVVVIAVIGAVMLYNRFVLFPKEQEAQSQMFVGEQYFARDSFNLAINGDGSYYLGFEWIMDEYSATKSANLASYYTGVSYMHLGKYEEAISYLDKFSTDDPMITPIAIGAKADCYVELGEYKKAAKLFLEAASFTNDFSTPIHLKKAGIAFEAAEDAKSAIKAYMQIKNDYPASAEARDIDKFIAMVKNK